MSHSLFYWHVDATSHQQFSYFNILTSLLCLEQKCMGQWFCDKAAIHGAITQSKKCNTDEFWKWNVWLSHWIPQSMFRPFVIQARQDNGASLCQYLGLHLSLLVLLPASPSSFTSFQLNCLCVLCVFCQ